MPPLNARPHRASPRRQRVMRAAASTVKTWAATTTAGTCANNYTRTKTWHAVDACGNTSGTVSQTITVRDTTAPTIGGEGSDATIECPATPSFTAPTASDACGASTVQRPGETTTAGTCANNYTAAKTWHAVDACGNTSVTRTQTITVRDTTAPTIGGQGSDATIECPATPSFTAPTASDACGASTVIEVQRHHSGRDVRQQLHADQDLACGGRLRRTPAPRAVRPSRSRTPQRRRLAHLAPTPLSHVTGRRCSLRQRPLTPAAHPQCNR